MANKIVIILDSNEGHIVSVLTTDPTLEVELVDLDTDLDEKVRGPYDPEVTELVEDVDVAALQHILEADPDYAYEKQQQVFVCVNACTCQGFGVYQCPKCEKWYCYNCYLSFLPALHWSKEVTVCPQCSYEIYEIYETPKPEQEERR